jgi:DNA-binding NtrC family response regulator
MNTILIIDDDRDMCLALTDLLEKEYNVRAVYNGKAGLKSIEDTQPDLVLLDYRLPDTDGMKVLEKIKKINKGLPVIILTAFGEVKTAVGAMKAGAYDYIAKPFENDEIRLVVEKVMQVQSLSREVMILKQRLEEKNEFPNFVGKSPVMQKVYEQIQRVAPTNFTVFLQGESGTGKELAARTIHFNSMHKEKPFITVDCGALPETLIESELFGYEKGAFTGADKNKLGQFELAEGGTIFLDEITNLTPSTQAKLLRVIQEREIQHLGGKKKISVNVRVITASNLPLEKAVETGRLREDLYHRLNEFNIYLPSLRKRGEDIILLADYFLNEANKELRRNVRAISKKASSLLQKYSWPGNVRELRNAVKRAVLLADDIVLPEYLQISHRSSESLENIDTAKKRKVPLKKAKDKAIESTEKKAIQEALIKTKYHRGKTAKILGISYRALYNKIKKYGI